MLHLKDGTDDLSDDAETGCPSTGGNGTEEPLDDAKLFQEAFFRFITPTSMTDAAAKRAYKMAVSQAECIVRYDTKMPQLFH